MLSRIIGFTLLPTVCVLLFYLATRVHNGLIGPNFSDVGVPMHNGKGLATMAGLACILAGMALLAWLLSRTLLDGLGGWAWGLAGVLALLAAGLFWIGAMMF